MARARSEDSQEWARAGKSIFSMYGNFFFWVFREPFPVSQLGHQIVRVILEAFGAIMITAVVQGGLFAWLGGWDGSRFSVVNWTGSIVVYLLLSESTTLMGSMIFAARIGTAFTVEIGSMQMSGQLDALRLMAVEPSQQIVIPRVLAGLIMIPALTVLANLSGVLSGWISVKAVLPVTDADFIYGAQYYWRPWDAYYSIIKAFFFAGSITIIACYMGFNTQQGAEGVGRSTTTAVVTSSVLILLLDTVLTRLLLNQ